MDSHIISPESHELKHWMKQPFHFVLHLNLSVSLFQWTDTQYLNRALCTLYGPYSLHATGAHVCFNERQRVCVIPYPAVYATSCFYLLPKIHRQSYPTQTQFSMCKQKFLIWAFVLSPESLLHSHPDSTVTFAPDFVKPHHQISLGPPYSMKINISHSHRFPKQ